MSMSPQDQAYRSICEDVFIRRQIIRLAKSRILEAVKTESVRKDHQGLRSTELAEWFITSVESDYPARPVFHGGQADAETLVQVSREVSLKAAAAEAILDLIHSGALVSTTHALEEIGHRVSYSTVFGNQTNQSNWEKQQQSTSRPGGTSTLTSSVIMSSAS